MNDQSQSSNAISPKKQGLPSKQQQQATPQESTTPVPATLSSSNADGTNPPSKIADNTQRVVRAAKMIDKKNDAISQNRASGKRPDNSLDKSRPPANPAAPTANLAAPAPAPAPAGAQRFTNNERPPAGGAGSNRMVNRSSVQRPDNPVDRASSTPAASAQAPPAGAPRLDAATMSNGTRPPIPPHLDNVDDSKRSSSAYNIQIDNEHLRSTNVGESTSRDEFHDEELADDQLHVTNRNKKESANLQNNNAPLSLVFNEWAQGASMHGIPFTADGQTWKCWKRVMWIILVMGAGGLMIWQIQALIQQFKAYDVITQTETVSPDWLPFPEVTICSTNIFSQSALDKYNITDPVNETQLWLVAHQNYITGTIFNDIEIPEKDLSKFWTPRITDEGICYSFQTNEKVYRPGIYGGLEFSVYLNQDDFSEDTKLAGISMYVEQPGTPIHDQLPLVFIAAGKSTVAAMEVTEFNRERQAPWSRCASDAPNYTQSLCHTLCLNDQIRKDCGCRVFSDYKDSTMRYCQYDAVPMDDKCTLNIWNNEEDFFNTCGDCSKPPCSETTYRVTTTELEFSEILYDELLEDNNITADEFYNNFLRVQLNYASIKMEQLSETKALTLEQLLGSIGGSMGLFMGISAISVFEIFGDFLALRVIPRIFGYRNLRGVGARL
ncbi:hypothetical protein ACA910_006170 [Epithemia clementina (nom. ined.)]